MHAAMRGYALYVEPPPRRSVFVGETIELKARVTATGSEDIDVLGARLPCGCLEIRPIPMRVPRGSSEDVTIVFDITNRKPMEFKVCIDLYLGVASKQVSIPLDVRIVE